MSAFASHITLSQLNGIIQESITASFTNRSFWIVADITEHSFKEATGYHYFEFVEKNPNSNTIVAKIKGAAWGESSVKIKKFEALTGQKFTNNIHVLVKVSVTFHKVFGLSLNLEEIDTNFTLGVIEAKRQETLLKLLTNHPNIIQKRGNIFFTKNKQLSFPPVISKIAVVSSKTSAGNEDFKHTLLNNPYGFHFEIDDYHTVVQNEANAGKFLESLIAVFSSGIKYDAVIINRGGGSQTDFLIFDNYKIGLAVAKFPIPIITGIGHHKNETIADLMANTATKTPTKAAEFIITHNKMFEDSLTALQQKIIIKAQNLVSNNNKSFDSLRFRFINSTQSTINQNSTSLFTCTTNITSFSRKIINNNRLALQQDYFILNSKPQLILANEARTLKDFRHNISLHSKIFLSSSKEKLDNIISIINIISPENILKKGFALIKKDGEVISNPSLINAGDQIEIILQKNNILSKVKSNTSYNGNDFKLPDSL